MPLQNFHWSHTAKRALQTQNPLCLSLEPPHKEVVSNPSGPLQNLGRGKKESPFTRTQHMAPLEPSDGRAARFNGDKRPLHAPLFLLRLRGAYNYPLVISSQSASHYLQLSLCCPLPRWSVKSAGAGFSSEENSNWMVQITTLDRRKRIYSTKVTCSPNIKSVGLIAQKLECLSIVTPGPPQSLEADFRKSPWKPSGQGDWRVTSSSPVPLKTHQIGSDER
ncbi:hypothetical protein TNCV_2863571 [Trichonephila clavipes]|nr:hypothetical protein TNCV_2863571 [Trichonephila clavipes]